MDQTELNSAAVSLRCGKTRLVAKVKVSNRGLVAIGGLVSSILVSTSFVIWVSTSAARHHPLTTDLLRRR